MKLRKNAARRRGITLAEMAVALALIMIVSVATTTLYLSVSEKEADIADTMEYNEHVENIIECYQWANGDPNKTKDALAAAGYDRDSVTFDAPTCDKKGQIVYDTGHGITYTAEIAPTGHSMGDWTVDVGSNITCTDGGSKHRNCERCDYTESGVIDPLGHVWNETAYVFAEDGSSCTATRTCKRDKDHKGTVLATITSEVKTPATCEGEGTTTYTAAFGVEWAGTLTLDVQDPALGHDWTSSVGYSWTQLDGVWYCTAFRICARDGCGHSETAKATEISSEVTIPATCTTMGTTTYTATFDKEWATTQTKKVNTTGHIWVESEGKQICSLCGTEKTDESDEEQDQPVG